MTALGAVRVQGLNEFVRNLRKIDSDLPKAMRVALNESADTIVQAARKRVPNRSGRAARSIVARSTRTAVRVVGGGRRTPYYPWLDFGGRVGRRRSVRRAFIKEGRYIYAAYFDKRMSGEFDAALAKSLLDVVRSAGVQVD